jgi:hypothetical protein
LNPKAISWSKYGAGRAAAPKNAKQNTTEVQTQEISMIAMRQNTAFRVPVRSQVFDLEPIATLIPGKMQITTRAFGYCSRPFPCSNELK